MNILFIILHSDKHAFLNGSVVKEKRISIKGLVNANANGFGPGASSSFCVIFKV
jgi:hypothetical protein